MIPASDGAIFNGQDVGSRAAVAAERALTISPEFGYSLHDIVSDSDALDDALASPIAGRLLLQGTIDGVRAEYADGFGLARASNTTPVIVIRFEADNAAALERIKTDFRAALQPLKPDAPLPY